MTITGWHHPQGCACGSSCPGGLPGTAQPGRGGAGALPYAANLVTVALGGLALVVIGRAYLRGGARAALRAAGRR